MQHEERAGMKAHRVQLASACTGEDTPWRRQGWKLAQAYVSPVGVGMRLLSEKTCCHERREQLFDLLFNFREIALQSDLLMPFVVAVRGGETLRKAVQAWRRRQEFHRAAFLLLPEDPASGEECDRLLETMLWPKARDIVSYRPNATRSLQDFWQEVESAADEGQNLDRDLVNALSGWNEAKIQANISPKRAWDLWQPEWDRLFSAWDGKTIFKQAQEQGSPEEDEKRQAPDRVYTRIRSAAIKGFKGIGTVELDLDADIVLVTGANGNGKSSLVEALALALSGHHPAGDPEQMDSFFFYDEQQFRIRLKAGARDIETWDELPEELLEVTCDRKKKQREHRPRLDILRREITETGPEAGQEVFLPVASQLNFRMTTYLPDFVRLLFDEEAAPDAGQSEEEQDDAEHSHCLAPEDESVLLRQLFPPLAPSVEALCRVVDIRLGNIRDAQESLNRQIDDLENVFAPWEEWKEFFLHLEQRFHRLPVPGADRLRLVPSLAPEARGVTELRQWLAERRKGIGDLFNAWLDNWSDLLEFLREQGRKHALGEMADRLDALEEEIKELHKRKENKEAEHSAARQALAAADIDLLREALALLGDQGRRTDLVRDLDSLVRLPGPEQQEKARQGKLDIVREVELVDPGRAHRCANMLGNLVGIGGKKVRDLEEELEQIKEQLAGKEADLKTLLKNIDLPKAFEDAEDLLEADESKNRLDALDVFEKRAKNYENLLEERRVLQARKEQLDRLSGIIRAQRDKVLAEQEKDGDVCSFHQAFEKTMNRILRRFVLADGIDQVELTPEFRITAVDRVPDGQEPQNRRGLDCFSSGQKAQLAMAWLVASRELVHHDKISQKVRFPHRILIMDDPSTTFDTTNLLSQAILWRQLAYNPDPRRRYQVFIVSHHEEFSARLLDLLCPPEGNTMRLLRFTDWRVGTGAEVSGYTVSPAPDSIETARQIFGRGLQYFGEMA